MSEVQTAGGSGGAHGASVSVAELEEALKAAREADELEQPAREMAAYDRRVETAEAELAAAKEARAAHKAAVKGS